MDQSLDSYQALQLDHRHATLPTAENDTPKRKLIKFNCDCGYETTHKHRLTVHRAEHCQKEAEKDVTCSICFKKFTRNGFRSHLRHFIKGKHDSRGKHGGYTKEYHQQLLDKFKSS